MKDVLERVDEISSDDVEIVGVVPDVAHTSYTVFVKSKDSGGSPREVFVPCDRVARRLFFDSGTAHVSSVQKLERLNPPLSGAAVKPWFCVLFFEVCSLLLSGPDDRVCLPLTKTRMQKRPHSTSKTSILATADACFTPSGCVFVLPLAPLSQGPSPLAAVASTRIWVVELRRNAAGQLQPADDPFKISAAMQDIDDLAKAIAAEPFIAQRQPTGPLKIFVLNAVRIYGKNIQ